VTVVDTTKPNLQITHANTKHNIRGKYVIDFDAKNIFKHINDDYIVYHSTGFDKDTEYLGKLASNGYGYKCKDTCKGATKVATQWSAQAVDGSWTETTYDNTVAGTFKLDYKCTDAAGNSASKTRTVINEDKGSLAAIVVEFDVSDNVVDEAFIEGLVKIIKARGIKFNRKHVEIVVERRLREVVTRKLKLRLLVQLGAQLGKINLGGLVKFMRKPVFVQGIVAAVKKANPNVGKIACKASPPQVKTTSAFLPIIYVTGGDVEVVEASTTATYKDAGATCSDKQDGLIYTNQQGKGKVTLKKVINTQTVTYSCMDKDENEAIDVERYITTVDTTKPVCKLVGSSSVTHEAGFTYSDKGVVCKDSLDGVVKSTVSGSVDTKKVGTYYVRYTAKDAQGNKAATVTRKIVIRDTLKPVIGLNYNNKVFHVSDSTDTATLHDGRKVVNPAGKYFGK